MNSKKFDTQRFAKPGDLIVVTRDGGENITKGKEYIVTHAGGGVAGQSVGFIGDDGQYTRVNGLWWDFP